jgi:hypothetical protein
MNYNTLLMIFMAVAAQLQKDFSDKQITVDELIGVIKTTVDAAGVGDKVILDLRKKEG